MADLSHATFHPKTKDGSHGAILPTEKWTISLPMYAAT